MGKATSAVCGDDVKRFKKVVISSSGCTCGWTVMRPLADADVSTGELAETEYDGDIASNVNEQVV